MINSLVNEKYDVTRELQKTKYGRIELPKVNAGLSKKERAFLDLALKLAETSEVDNRHGAVVVQGGRVLSLGINKWRNRDMVTTEGDYNENLTVHAEIDALSRVADARGSVIYIGRVGKDGTERFSRPCSRCMAEIVRLDIKRVVYTVD